MAAPLSRLFAVLLTLAAGCNRVEMFRVAGHVQEDFSNDADILFVIDDSSSMMDEAEELALNFDTFIRQFAAEAGTNEGLVEAVDDYIGFVQRSGAIDYHMAITTTDVSNTDPDKGYGALRGDPKVLDNGYDDPATAFSRNLLCDVACILEPENLASDPDYECADPPPPPGDAISVQYLDCLCGGATWEDGEGDCGSGTEEHLEAVFMAMCRSVEDPPEECFGQENQFDQEDVMSNGGFLRPGGKMITILVTDEGDNSRRLSQGEEDPSDYAALYEKFGIRMAWAVIGPELTCNSGNATSWGVERFNYFVNESGGLYVPIEEGTPPDCQVTDFAAAMEQLGQLLNRLLDAFVLQAVPDVDTIVVFVDGKMVDQSEETVLEDGTIEYTDGWSYLAAENAVQFHGSAIPDYNALVRIYYLPLEGMPRELPF